MARPCYLGLMMSVVCLTALNTPTQVTAQKPPNCPQLLAQAQQKMAAATKALDAANAKLNTTLPSLTQMVTLAHQNETTWGTKYNAAMTTYANAISQHAAAVNGLNLAEASLNETVSLCKQPVKPPNCPDLLKKAQDTVNSDKTNLVNTVTALNTATAAKNATYAALQESIALYNQALESKNNAVKAMQDTINKDIQAKQEAVEQYEEIVAECK